MDTHTWLIKSTVRALTTTDKILLTYTAPVKMSHNRKITGG